MNRKEMFSTPLWKDIRGRIKKKNVKKVADALELEIMEETDMVLDCELILAFIWSSSLNGDAFWRSVNFREF